MTGQSSTGFNLAQTKPGHIQDQPDIWVMMGFLYWNPTPAQQSRARFSSWNHNPGQSTHFDLIPNRLNPMTLPSPMWSLGVYRPNSPHPQVPICATFLGVFWSNSPNNLIGRYFGRYPSQLWIFFKLKNVQTRRPTCNPAHYQPELAQLVSTRVADWAGSTLCIMWPSLDHHVLLSGAGPAWT